MTVNLERLTSDGVLGPLQMAFAKMIGRIDPSARDTVLLAAALVSEQLTRGHICLDLAQADQIVFGFGNDRDQAIRYDRWPAIDRWLKDLAASPSVLVRESRDDAQHIDRPLVLEKTGRKLYLARYWYYQQQLAHSILQRIAMPSLEMDENSLRSDIARLFPDRHAPGDAGQCLAAASTIDQRFGIITGGPGTGKTTTVAKLLALRIMQQPNVPDDGELRVLLMAPTGKAAQRLNESLGRVANALDIDESVRKQLLGIQAGTIHRILRWTPLPPELGGPFSHGSDYPVEADVVLVDEASMVDIGLMSHLFSAVPMQAQLILMGDRDQLASVEAGSILGDLCGDLADAATSRLSARRRQAIAGRTGIEPDTGTASRHALADHIMPLRHSHRFDPSSSLGRMAAAVRAGDAEGVIAELHQQEPSDGPIVWIQPEKPSATLAHIAELATEEYTAYLKDLAQCPEGRPSVLQSLLRFRVLCAHREGLWGEVNLNRVIAERLDRLGLIRLRRHAYLGQPVMVTRNDYRQELFNGDVGVVVRDPGGEELAVMFESAAHPAGCRRVPAALVPETRPCYALTIHKSQGSEFHHVMVVLPHRPSPILTRELLYTGITRVADWRDPATHTRHPGKLYLVTSEPVLRETIHGRIRRSSGLKDAIQASTSG